MHPQVPSAARSHHATKMYGQVGDSEYWSGLVLPATWVDMAQKYATLYAMASMNPDAARGAALRSAARAWPGALREGELAGPQVCAWRREFSQTMLCRPACTRAHWRDHDAAAVVLWADLHALLSDQLAFKRAHHRPDPEAFVRWLGGSARLRWPSAATLVARCGGAIRPRQAYLWLATRAGLSLPQLNHRLFARTGPWDHRSEDPEWTRIG